MTRSSQQQQGPQGAGVLWFYLMLCAICLFGHANAFQIHFPSRPSPSSDLAIKPRFSTAQSALHQQDWIDIEPILLQSSAEPTVASSSLASAFNSLAHATATNEAAAAGGLLDTVLSYPAVWSLSIMLTLVALLYGWETFVETVRETIPKTFAPVFEKMWAEVAGLGFVGLVLQVLVHPLEPWLGHLSEHYLGEEEILLESFEFLHTAFFQVGIAFFAAAGYQVAVSLQNIDQVAQLEGIGLDATTGACMATEKSLADFVNAPTLKTTTNKELSNEQALAQLEQRTVWDELQLSSEQRNAESLVIRSYLAEQGKLPMDARVEPLMEARFSTLLLELVELSPLTWLPLIPALALANAVDLSHDVVNSASPNAAAAAGFFFSSPQVLIPSVAIVSMSAVWGYANFWKLSTIKQMMLPTLVRQQEQEGATIIARMLPPRFTIPSQVESFASRSASSPPVLAAVERLFSDNKNSDDDDKYQKTAFEALYGATGDAGELYLQSLRSHTWLCITSIVFFGTQIIPRDLHVLLSGGAIAAGDPASVLPEFLTYSLLVAVSFALLAVSPTTFLNYSLCDCFVEHSSEDEVCNGAEERIATEEAADVSANVA